MGGECNMRLRDCRCSELIWLGLDWFGTGGAQDGGNASGRDGFGGYLLVLHSRPI